MPSASRVVVRPSILRLILRACAVPFALGCGSVPLPIPGFGGGGELWGIASPWDARSAATLAERADDLDVAVTGWIGLDSLTGQPALLFPDTAAGAARAERRFAYVTVAASADARAVLVRALGADASVRARVAGAVGALVRAGGYRGIVIDLPSLAPAHRAALVSLVRALADSSRARGASVVAVAVPPSDTAGYPGRALLGGADFLMVKLYDQHWPASSPGAVAEPEWARRQLALRSAEVGASRLIAALPTFGYQWQLNATAGREVGFEEARRLAATAGVYLERDPPSGSLRARREGEWEVWIGDAEHVSTLAANARAAGVRRVALVRLGLEDPALWERLAR
jgi:spore germination protein YaaH